MSLDEQYVIGVDVGGTNTDTAVLHGGRVIGFAKRPTSCDKTEGVINSIEAALRSLPAETRDHLVSTSNVRVAIGTTHFTNAVIERDEKNLTCVAVIRLCGTSTRSLPPFVDVPQDLSKIVNGGCYLVQGGMEYDTREISSINEDEIRQCVSTSLSRDSPVKNFVICGVFSPCADPERNQETRTAAIVRDECKKRGVECSCTLSHEFGTLGLLERENAAILNESLKDMAAQTINAFGEALYQLKLCSSKQDFYLTQNDGTLISSQEAKCYPVLTFSSGPTNSMRGAAFLTKHLNAIVVDIGGTTTDVGVLVNGFPRQSSTQCEVGGVNTNFPMPDVQSIGLGGGSVVTFDSQSGRAMVGPKSVGYEITKKALCFGGKQCTATDVALAAGVAPSNFCTARQAVASLSTDLVAAAMNEMKNKLENAIDSMKTENEACPVILVGGGSILVDRNTQLRGVSTIECPSEHFGVANAVGAALGTVGGSSDRIINLAPIREQLLTSDPSLGQESGDKRAREVAMERGREQAMEEVRKKGGIANTVYIHSEEVIDVTYVTDRVRVKVKAIGALTQDSLSTAAQPYTASTSPSTTEITVVTAAGSETSQFTPNIPGSVEDNPSWPSASEEEQEKDLRAGLPTPLVDKETGVWTLSEHDVVCLATGAAILGCGGGGSPYFGQLRAVQLIKSGKTIKIVNPFRLQQEDKGLVCALGFMGAPAIIIEKPPNGRETCLALDTLRRVLASGVCKGMEGGKVSREGVEVVEKTYPWIDGTKFTGSFATRESLGNVNMTNVPKERCITCLICLEAGGFNSIEPLLVGAIEDVPVLDVDGMGRAFPELQMFIPFINGSRHTPSSLADNQGECIACTHIGSSKDLENFFRLETVRMGISAAIATGVMSYDEMMSKCVLLTMSQAWQLGRAVLRARATHTNVVQAVVEMQHGLILLVGKVISVQRATKGGFSTLETVVEGLDGYSGHQLRVLAKNENYIAQRIHNGALKEVLACTPDLISIIDSNTGDAITTELIRYGLRVGVVVLPANHMLKTEQALKFVGPAAFGFDIPYQEPKSFPSADH